ncbi:transcriptional repressor LexA [Elioraea rosea]|uniref:transcriptional repressor LexA n=1 Tax=Elioraea rosea TaxID=2492390 RepID=UPI001182D41F|nr:transcriptional repressor LexA [Elioraea rosea]
MLTRKQHELLSFIAAHCSETGTSPSFEEMKEALNLRSKSGIHRLVTALEERGFIRRHAHRARAVEVVRLPDYLAPGRRAGARRGEPVLVAESGGNVTAFSRRAEAPPARPAGSVPILGRIAAGQPIEAVDTSDAEVPISPEYLGTGDHFALVVSGDSMTGDGIHDGDLVLIKSAQDAPNGAIVVALIDEFEVTLKRLRRRKDVVALESSNPAYQPRIIPADRVRIQGRLVGLFRRFDAQA